MTDMPPYIGELKALLAQATPGPWECGVADCCERYDIYTPDDLIGSFKTLVSDDQGRADVTLLVALRNQAHDLIALVDVALSARGVDDRFAYFCGCCWKRVKKRQERAAEIVAMADAGGDAPPTPLVTRWTLAEIDALVADWTKASETWGTAGACCAASLAVKLSFTLASG